MKREENQLHKILHKTTGEELFSSAKDSWREAVEDAMNQEVSLAGANLSRLDLHGLTHVPKKHAWGYVLTDLKEANFSHSNLRSASLPSVELTAAALIGADLTDANLSGAWMMRADLRDASARGANFSQANLASATLDAKLDHANFDGSLLKYAKLRDASAVHASFKKASMFGATLTNSEFAATDFSGANLENANFSGSRLVGAIFRGANLTRTDLRDADLRHADLNCSNLSRANAGTARGNLLRLTGTRDSMIVVNESVVAIGCYVHSLDWWAEHYNAIGKVEGYSREEIEEYRGHLEYARGWLAKLDGKKAREAAK